MNEQYWNRSLLITTLVVGVVAVLSLGATWNSAPRLIARFSFSALVPVLSAAFVSYAIRTLRFYYFVKSSGIVISLRDTILVQVMGFAFSVTPGRMGEVFKLHLLRERAGTPVTQTTPLLLLDRLTEGGGFLLLAVGSAFALPSVPAPIPISTLTLLGLSGLLVFGLTYRRWSKFIPVLSARLEKWRWGKRWVPYLQNLWRGLETSFSPMQILGGLALSTVARFADGVAVLFTAQMLGVTLALPIAVFVLAVSGLVGGVSFLPAGTGAVETTLSGFLVLFGVNLSTALTIALVTRFFVLWLWVALGLILILESRLLLRRGLFKATEEP